MEKSKTYTKTGDKGLTSLIGGKKIAKSCLRLESYGTVDELNSFVGLLIEDVADETDKATLLKIQSLLFIAGCSLATEPGKEPFCTLSDDHILFLENEIDRIDSMLPSIRDFVLPGGSRSSALAHVCRTVCRRCERVVCKLKETENVDNSLPVFLNRLSDYLFVLARKLLLLEKRSEIIWDKTCK